MVVRAMKYRIGFQGSWKPCCGRYGLLTAVRKKRKKSHRFQEPYEETAYEEEHAIVHAVNQYRSEVAKNLRDIWGNTYEVWQVEEDQRKIPFGMLL
jgi:hypothetical protein